MAVLYDTLLTNFGFRVGFVSKYIPFFWLNITFLSLSCQCVFICKSALVKGEMSDSFTNYNYVGNTKVSVSIKKLMPTKAR